MLDSPRSLPSLSPSVSELLCLASVCRGFSAILIVVVGVTLLGLVWKSSTPDPATIKQATTTKPSPSTQQTPLPITTGLARKAKGDLAGAVADYSQAIALDPNMTNVHDNRGRARHRQGDLAGAISDFDQAIARAPQDAEAYFLRGNVRYDQGDLAGSVATTTKPSPLTKS